MLQKKDNSSVDVGYLMSQLSSHVGIEGFQKKVDCFWRSEPLQRPARRLSDIRLYDHSFRSFVWEQKMSVQRRMVQLYVAGTAKSGERGLSHDVSDHYKQLIRVSDDSLREERRENERLRKEVELFMFRSLSSASLALNEKAEAFSQENEVLRSEVAQLTEELEEKARQLEHERGRSCVTLAELARQLRSVSVGYEQVKRASAA